MRLLRALPLSLVALLASTGCVSVGGPRDGGAPARDAVPPVDAPDLSRPDAGSPAAEPAGRPAEPLPLGELPAEAAPARAATDRDSGHEPSRRAAKAPRPTAERRAKPATPRRAHPPRSTADRPDRPARDPVPPLPRADEFCSAAEGALPPSIVDLCIRQATGR